MSEVIKSLRVDVVSVSLDDRIAVFLRVDLQVQVDIQVRISAVFPVDHF